MSRPTVIVDAFAERARQHAAAAIVAVDVIRASTTAVTAVATGRRCFPVPSLAAALRLRTRLEHPLLVGELGGRTPDGFHLGNSPAALAARPDVTRPMILLSSSGTKLMHAARGARAVYLGCLRNAAAIARHLAGRHEQVAVIGAGSRGEFRREDQICCSWIAGALLAAGYEAADARTRAIVARWEAAPAMACADGRSAQYLRRSGQLADLDFVLAHVNDVEAPCALVDGEAVLLPADRVAGTTRREAGVGA